MVDLLRCTELSEERFKASRALGVEATGFSSCSTSMCGVVAVRAMRLGRKTAHQSSWSRDSSTSTWS
jgi:hypothetical protein